MKKTLALLAMMVATRVFPCQQQAKAFSYQDYIYGINNFVTVSQVQTTEDENGVKTHYTVRNNQEVDLPLTVFVKLTSNTMIGATEGEQKEMIRAKLQYRILGKTSSTDSSDWITVRDLSKPQGTISKAAPPGAYFGRNNIDPYNIQPGDVIMIRYYVTDGTWQSGVEANKCKSLLTTVGGKYTLPNSYDYTYEGSPIYDLGDGWQPHFVTTVIWSGKRRPTK